MIQSLTPDGDIYFTLGDTPCTISIVGAQCAVPLLSGDNHQVFFVVFGQCIVPFPDELDQRTHTALSARPLDLLHYSASYRSTRPPVASAIAF